MMLLVESGETTLVLADQHRIESALAVPGNVQHDPLAAHVDRLAGRAVAVVAGLSFARIGQMDLHLSAQHALAQGLLQLRRQGLEIKCPRAPRVAINSSSNSREMPSSCFFAIRVSYRIVHRMAHTHKNPYRLCAVGIYGYKCVLIHPFGRSISSNITRYSFQSINRRDGDSEFSLSRIPTAHTPRLFFGQYRRFRDIRL